VCIIAKRRRPDPAITEKWTNKLGQLRADVIANRAALKKSEDKLNDCVRAAFAEGVLVGPMTQATGLSSSRLFQIKFALRDAEAKSTRC